MFCAKAADLRLLQLLMESIFYVHVRTPHFCNHFRIIYLWRGAPSKTCPQLLGIVPYTTGSVILHAGAAVAQAPFVSRAESAPRHNLAQPSDSRHSGPTSRDTARASCRIGYVNAV